MHNREIIFKIVVDMVAHCAYLLINKTGNNKQSEDEMEAIDNRTLEFIKTMLTGNNAKDARWLHKNFKGVGYSLKEWAEIVKRALA